MASLSPSPPTPERKEKLLDNKSKKKPVKKRILKIKKSKKIIAKHDSTPLTIYGRSSQMSHPSRQKQIPSAAWDYNPDSSSQQGDPILDQAKRITELWEKKLQQQNDDTYPSSNIRTIT